ncbi:MAG: glycoside hydrolase [Verrucomicrobia bacterium]|nr:glycoside hydrolase [Verrucomicrobiota bacterium]
MRTPPRRLTSALLGLTLLAGPASAQVRTYLAPDDHTDYLWSATEAEYRLYFQQMLDFFAQAATTDLANGVPSALQSRFTLDGSFWLYDYERNPAGTQFPLIRDRVLSGHLTVPLNALILTYGGMPAEAVLRSMAYAGSLERRWNTRFRLAHTMENLTLPYGLGALWAGSGARYSWNGVCQCTGPEPSAADRLHEIYRWTGLDGSSLLLKWYSFTTNDRLGGYAEARFPADALAQLNAPAFTTRYRDLQGQPYAVRGAFGAGWDDRFTLNLSLRDYVAANTTPAAPLFVSNEIDFFQDFEATHGPSIPSYSASFGNEWDAQPASLAEVTGSVRRNVEKLRAAEAMTTLVTWQNPGFLTGRAPARDLAMMNLGLYFEHDFTDGGPGASRAERLAWQRRVANEIDSYVSTLHADAKTALGGLIGRSGNAPRFFVFNPLSWTRTDVVDLPYTGSLPAHVVDLATGLEVPSQTVTVNSVQLLRIQAPGVPSVGYKVFEVRSGAGASFANPFTVNAGTGLLANAAVSLTVSGRGAINSYVDKTRANREFAANLGGRTINDFGSGTGTVAVENAGVVSTTLRATVTGAPSRVTRITLQRDSDRVLIENEITQNFTDVRSWTFSFNLSAPDLWHEEVGAVLRARLLADGGHYAPQNARYDLLTLNHFADLTGSGPFGVTLSNVECLMMQYGNSTLNALDTATPQLRVFAGGQLGGYGISLQGGDSFFRQQFALRTHGAYSEVAAMRFALEHSNPLVAGAVTGTAAAYPADQFSAVQIDQPDVLLWALKPAEDGLAHGWIARVWNFGDTSATFALTLGGRRVENVQQTSHVETIDRYLVANGGALVDLIPAKQIRTYALNAVQPTAFDSWKQAYGLAAAAAATSDADGDGVALLLEYALGLDPTAGSAQQLPAVQLVGGLAQLTYPRLRSELSYAVEASQDLATWSTASVTQGSGAVGTNVTATAPLPAGGRLFLRLRVSLP